MAIAWSSISREVRNFNGFRVNNCMSGKSIILKVHRPLLTQTPVSPPQSPNPEVNHDFNAEVEISYHEEESNEGRSDLEPITSKDEMSDSWESYAESLDLTQDFADTDQTPSIPQDPIDGFLTVDEEELDEEPNPLSPPLVADRFTGMRKQIFNLSVLTVSDFVRRFR